MANEIFTALIARLVLDSETDADSPDNETTYDGMRKFGEGLLLSLFDTGVSGTVTGISSATLTDTGNFTTDQCNGWTLIMTSGDAKGNFYTIDDTTTNTLICTGDDLETDGVAIGDSYKVVYDIKVNADGHDHDGVNSKSPILADASITSAKYGVGSVDQTAIGALAVGQGELKTTSGSGSSAAPAFIALSGGLYSFLPQTKLGSASSGAYLFSLGGDASTSIAGWTSYATQVWWNAAGSVTGYAQNQYVQASGEIHWIFMLMEQGNPIGMWQAPDHPIYGMPGRMHPFSNYDPEKHEIIVVNPSLEDIGRIYAGMIPAEDGGYLTPEKISAGIDKDYFRTPDKDFLEVFSELYEIKGAKQEIWPEDPVTVDLPKIWNGQIVNDWRFMPRTDQDGKPVKVKPVQKVISRPDFITPVGYKRKK